MGGNAKGCKNLGGMYEYDIEVKQDTLKAKELYAKVCDSGNAQGRKNYARLNRDCR